MNSLLKICKVCKVEQQRQGDFSGRSAICCKCVYAKKKDYFKKYYESKLVGDCLINIFPLVVPSGFRGKTRPLRIIPSHEFPT